MAALSKSPLAIVTFGTRKVLANFQEQFSHHRMFSKKDFKNYEKLQNSIKQNSKVCVLQCNFFRPSQMLPTAVTQLDQHFPRQLPDLDTFEKAEYVYLQLFPLFAFDEFPLRSYVQSHVSRGSLSESS